MLLAGLKAEVGTDKATQIDQLIAQIPTDQIAEPAEGWQAPEALDSVNVFISYARKDSYDRSERLYKDLQAKGMTPNCDMLPILAKNHYCFGFSYLCG